MLHSWRCDPLNNFFLWFKLNTKISRPTLCLWTCIFPWENICACIPLAPKSIDWIQTEIEKRTTLNSRPVQLSIHTALTAHSCQFLERNFHIIRSPFPHSTQTSTKSTGQYSKLISALRLLHCLKCPPPIQKTKQITHSKKRNKQKNNQTMFIHFTLTLFLRMWGGGPGGAVRLEQNIHVIYHYSCTFMGLPWWLRWWRILPAIQETQVQSPGQENPLEKGMTIHSSMLAWRIPWMEEPGGYNPWGPKELDMAEWLTLSKLSHTLTTTLLFLQFTGLVS